MIFLNFIFISIFYFGFVYWKYLTWGGSFIGYLINPFPIHIDGVKLFHEYLLNYNNLAKRRFGFNSISISLKNWAVLRSYWYWRASFHIFL